MKSSRTSNAARNSELQMALFLLVLATTTITTSAFHMQRVLRPDFANAPSMFEDEPVVVEGVVSLPKCDSWIDHITKRSRHELVRLDHEHYSRSTKLPLGQATKLLSEKSSHIDPLYVTSIGSSCSTDQLPLHDTLEQLFVNDDTKMDDTTDWLDYFSRHAPIHDSLVIAGEGASAPAICSHPYTKMILCLEGSQLIRVMPPHPDWKAWSKPLWNRAWEEFPYSTGYKLTQDLNLFAYHHRDVEEEDPYDAYLCYAEDPGLLHPNFALPSLDDCDSCCHSLWHSSVLLPGDLAVVPPGWWYQTYNVEETPSITLQSQRCGGNTMGAAMVEHVLQCAFGNSRLQLLNPDKEYYYTKQEGQETVDKLFDLLQDHYDEASDGKSTRKETNWRGLEEKSFE